MDSPTSGIPGGSARKPFGIDGSAHFLQYAPMQVETN